MHHPGRRAPALLVLPALVVLALIYLGTGSGTPGYGRSQLMQGLSTMAIVVPIAAALAAYEGSRLRSARVRAYPGVRSPTAIALRSLLPVYVAAMVAVGVATLRTTLPVGGIGPADLVAICVPLAMGAGFLAVGYTLGLALPATVALPLAPVATWFCLVYPGAIEPLWLRHLTGYFSECCLIDTRPAPAAIAAPILVGLGLLGASWLTWSRIARSMRAGGAVVIVGAALALGAVLVSDLGASPTVARDPSELLCRGTTPRVCLWPEHSGAAELVAARARRAGARLAARGVRVPATVSERPEAQRDVWRIGLGDEIDEPAVDSVLLQGMLPDLPACAETKPYPADEVRGALLLWLADAGGVRRDVLGDSLPEDRRLADRVRTGDRAAQLAWFRSNVAALGRCGTPATPFRP